MKRLAFLLLALTAVSGCTPESTPSPSSTSLDTVSGENSPASSGSPDINFTGNDPLYPEISISMNRIPEGEIKVGQEVVFEFKASSDTDWHLYSSQRAGNIAYNPTELLIFEEDTRGIELVGKMTEDKKPQERYDNLLGGLVRDFQEHEVTYSQKLKIRASEGVLAAEFSGQVCTEKGMCKFFKFPVDWTFKAVN